MCVNTLRNNLIIDAQNPWPGLCAYNEKAQDFFTGREKEITEMLRLTGQAPLVVLFGKSGLGKSSLLKAGLFPRLRQLNYLPVYIRLDVHDTSVPLIEQAGAALKQEMVLQGVDGPVPGLCLWEYLHGADLQWWSNKKQPLTPVFVFDQFEEVFTHGTGNPGAIRQLHLDLADLIENRIPTRVHERAGEDFSSFELNSHRYKVILSFREDFLPEMEGWKGELPSLMRNRMRLLPMSADCAFRVVSGLTATGRMHELVDEDTAKEIVRFVAAAQNEASQGSAGSGTKTGKLKTADIRWEDLEIEPALLSLVCVELNKKRQAESLAAIDTGLLQQCGRGILGDFYASCIKDIPSETQRFIENSLITEKGFRNSYPLEDAPIAPNDLETLISRRLLRIDHQQHMDRVELIHDRLTGAVREHRDREREREREKIREKEREQERAIEREKLRLRKIRWAGIAACLLVLALCFGGYFFSKRLAESVLAGTLAAKSQGIVFGGDSGGPEDALLLATASYQLSPDNFTKTKLKDVFEFTSGIRKAALFPTTMAVSSPDNLWLAAWSKEKKCFSVWDVTRGQKQESPLPDGGTVECIVLGPGGRQLALGYEKQWKLLDVNKNEWLWQTDPTKSMNPVCGAFSLGRKLVVVDNDNNLHFINVKTGAIDWTQSLDEDKAGRVQCIALDREGGKLATGGDDGRLCLWSVNQGLKLGFLGVQKLRSEISCLAFSSDGNTLACGGEGGQVALWDIPNNTCKELNPTNSKDAITSLAFHPSGQYLLAGKEDYKLHLWDLLNKTYLGSLQGHCNQVKNALFRSDGSLLSVSTDNTLCEWRADYENTGSFIKEVKNGNNRDKANGNPKEIDAYLKDSISHLKDRVTCRWDSKEWLNCLGNEKYAKKTIELLRKAGIQIPEPKASQ